MTHIASSQIRKRNEDAYFDQRTTESLRRFREHTQDNTKRTRHITLVETNGIPNKNLK